MTFFVILAVLVVVGIVVYNIRDRSDHTPAPVPVPEPTPDPVPTPSPEPIEDKPSKPLSKGKKPIVSDDPTLS
jgi:hypothetical protein